MNIDCTLSGNTIEGIEDTGTSRGIIMSLTEAHSINRVCEQSLIDGINASLNVVLWLESLGFYLWDIPNYDYWEANISIDDPFNDLIELNWMVFHDMKKIVSGLSLEKVDMDLLIEHFEGQWYGDTTLNNPGETVWLDAILQAESFVRELKKMQRMLFSMTVPQQIHSVMNTSL